MVFQSFNLFAHKTIIKNVTLSPIKVRKLGKATTAEKRALELLKPVSIAPPGRQVPRPALGGQQQRVAITRSSR